MQTFIKDQKLVLDGVVHQVSMSSSSGQTLLENLATGEKALHCTTDLLKKWLSGQLLIPGDKPKYDREVRDRHGRAQVPNVSEAARATARRRMTYLLDLDGRGSFEKCRSDLIHDIKLAAEAIGDTHPPHITSVYRWRNKFLRSIRSVESLIPALNKRGGWRKSRLDPEIESAIDDAVLAMLKEQRSWCAEDVLDRVVDEIGKLNLRRTSAEQLTLPSLRTVQRRLGEVHSYDIAVARYGKREADRRHAYRGLARRVNRILEIVEIDHTPLDIQICNSERVVIGRPGLTLLIDRFSRCVLGFVVSMSGHGVPTVFASIQNAIFPKLYLDERYRELGLTWPCFGWFERIVMDNGTEFHADAVADALIEIGIPVEFAKSKEPNDKAVIERFLRTLNYKLIHTLPGTTLAKIHKRIGFKAEDEALLTLEELDRQLHVWICSVYHQRPHAGLGGRTPLAVWQESAALMPPQLKRSRDDVEIEFSEITTSAVQHYGIDLNTFRYASARLARVRSLTPARSKARVKWPRNDVGHIWVWDPTEAEYFKVPNLAEEYSGLTLEQARLAKQLKSSGDPANQQTQASAMALIRGHIAEAQTDKALKVRRRAARTNNETSAMARGTANKATGAQTHPTLASSPSDAVTDDDLEVVDVEVPWLDAEKEVA